jgi:hypothetical protein
MKVTISHRKSGDEGDEQTGQRWQIQPVIFAVLEEVEQINLAVGTPMTNGRMMGTPSYHQSGDQERADRIAMADSANIS